MSYADAVSDSTSLTAPGGRGRSLPAQILLVLATILLIFGAWDLCTSIGHSEASSSSSHVAATEMSADTTHVVADPAAPVHDEPLALCVLGVVGCAAIAAVAGWGSIAKLGLLRRLAPWMGALRMAPRSTALVPTPPPHSLGISRT